MGMYTELLLGVRLKAETPEHVIQTIHHMRDNTQPMPAEYPSHELFRTERWDWMLRSGGSYYFEAHSGISRFDFDEITCGWQLTVLFNIKNYSGEIEAFVDWIMPWVDAFPGTMLGYKRYEEADEPTIIRKEGKDDD